MKKTKQNVTSLLIANPISGSGKAKKHTPGVVRIFEEAGWDVDTIMTEKAGDAAKAASDFCGDVIIAFGGDGTFNEILRGANLEGVTLSVIPAGTGNVLAKEIGMPHDPAEAARTILEGTAAVFDVPHANSRRFAFACGVGLDAHIVRMLHEERSGNITQFHYLPHLLSNALPPPHWDITVETEEGIHSDGVNLVCIGNTKSYGGPIELTPLADPTDGLLDIAATRVHSLLDMPMLGLATLTSGMADCSSTNYARAREITITAPEEGENVPYHLDGDFAGNLPLKISVGSEKMKVIINEMPN